LFEESGVQIYPEIKSLKYSGYQGIHKLHQNSALQKKKTKKNRELSSERVLNENVIGIEGSDLA
jgi:hypothetical protein